MMIGLERAVRIAQDADAAHPSALFYLPNASFPHLEERSNIEAFDT